MGREQRTEVSVSNKHHVTHTYQYATTDNYYIHWTLRIIWQDEGNLGRKIDT